MPRAISAATPMAASTPLAFIFPDEQALPAETEIPARSSCTSRMALATPGMAIRADRRDARRSLRRSRSPPAALTPSSSRRREGRQAAPCRKAEPPAQRRSPRAAGSVLRAAAIALLLPAARLRAWPGPCTSSTPDARRPAELVGAGGDEIRVRKRHLARALGAVGRAAASPRRGSCSPMRSSGWITPVSLLTCWIATSAGPPASTSSSAAVVDQPVGSDRNDLATWRPSRAGTIACSVAPCARPRDLRAAPPQSRSLRSRRW